MDLTTLSGDDTPGNVRRLCAKARRPLRDDLAKALGVSDLGVTVGAVCVYHALVPTAVDALAGSDIPAGLDEWRDRDRPTRGHCPPRDVGSIITPSRRLQPQRRLKLNRHPSKSPA